MKRRQRHKQDDARDQIVVTVPIQDLGSSWKEIDSARRNPGEKYPRRRRGAEVGIHQETWNKWYDGHAGLLVRTALVRAENYAEAIKAAPRISSAEDVAKLCGHMRDLDHEYAVTLALNTQNRVIAIAEAAVGDIAEAAVSPRSAVKVPLLAGAVAMVAVHNHPSGSSAPSHQDDTFTRALAEAAECAGVALLDHVIIAHGGIYSYLSMGKLPSLHR